MGLKEGDLRNLIVPQNHPSLQELARDVLYHVLQALDFLAGQDLVHRDVKPANILYETRAGKYHFALGDFGLSRQIDRAESRVGTPNFLAPEVIYGHKQTHKMDVWSLFVTYLWILDIEGFRRTIRTFTSDEVAFQKISSAGTLPGVNEFQEMAKIDSSERASAAQMLLKCWDGRGLTTRRYTIVPLSNDTSEMTSLLASLVRTNRRARSEGRSARQRASARDNRNVTNRRSGTGDRITKNRRPQNRFSTTE